MAQHAQFSIDSGVAVYFCDPRSPWQRGSNENTNGLLRQYLAKNADLRDHTQADLDQIAALRLRWATRGARSGCSRGWTEAAAVHVDRAGPGRR